MPTRAIDLSETLDSFVEASIRSGTYADASAVVREGLALLRERQDHAAKVEALRAALVPAEEALARGNVREVAPDELDGYLAGLGRTGAPASPAR